MPEIEDHLITDEIEGQKKSYADRSYTKVKWSYAITFIAVPLLGGMDNYILIFILSLMFVLSLFGFIQGIQSFLYKEPETVEKYFGILGNFIYILFLIYFTLRAY